MPHPPTAYLPAGDGGLGDIMWEVPKGWEMGLPSGSGAPESGAGDKVGDVMGDRLEGMCWAPRILEGVSGREHEGWPVGLGMLSRHRRSRVSSPAHSVAVTSPSSTTCVPRLQHGRRPLRSCKTSARRGARRGAGEAGHPLHPSPRAQGPKAWEPARAHPFPSLYIHVHLRISACLSAHPAQDLPLLLPQLQPAASLTRGQALPERPAGLRRGWGVGGGLLRVLLHRWPSPPSPPAPLPWYRFSHPH